MHEVLYGQLLKSYDKLKLKRTNYVVQSDAGGYIIFELLAIILLDKCCISATEISIKIRLLQNA